LKGGGVDHDSIVCKRERFLWWYHSSASNMSLELTKADSEPPLRRASKQFITAASKSGSWGRSGHFFAEESNWLNAADRKQLEDKYDQMVSSH